eukprot:TRINITY_DN2202_c0_g1_i1.p1 TRINITY_DN2202_c0_g1~~TRINITY_DN2202_c0_g1_i1.p1  ORF type:complete len:314 (-),score=46.06 TRINITY_DN2202_c0_g1_i1:84-947(-)
MRSIIFANHIARNTHTLHSTIEVEASHIRFLGNLTLHLWDCGGQDHFMENYFTNQRDNIFRSVAVLIYVFDVESKEPQKDIRDFQNCIDALMQHSPDSKIFCLIHKMDLLTEEQGERVFQRKEHELSEIVPTQRATFFKTSIWDETLYLAWSSIVYSLIPNIKALEAQLNNFCNVCEADEVALFEKATFLVISHANTQPHDDVHRFEKISNIIKQFKLTCSKSQAHFQRMEVRNSNFTAFIDTLTSNTYIMVIMSDTTIQSTTININIKVARSHFEKYLQSENSESL